MVKNKANKCKKCGGKLVEISFTSHQQGCLLKFESLKKCTDCYELLEETKWKKLNYKRNEK